MVAEVAPEALVPATAPAGARHALAAALPAAFVLNAVGSRFTFTASDGSTPAPTA